MGASPPGASDIESKMKPTIQQRITEILGEDYSLDEIISLEYSWSNLNNTGAGYEKLEVKHASGGGLNFEGVFHPNIVCEGGGICCHCGRTLIFN